MNTIQLLLLFHIFALGIPLLVVSLLLFFTTLEIRRFLNRYGEQARLFTGILAIGYLFIFISIMHEVEHVFEWYGDEPASLVAGAVSHGVTLLVLVIVFYNFYEYRKAIRVGAGGERKPSSG
ncbi:MAG: hypothetical protein JRM80_05280 [Nitrososphaerota archaeon]|nr:hypothetical protein [Nitrososphaerota archaeon]